MGHSDEEEAELVHRALDIDLHMTDRKPLGYRTPVYNATPGVIGRLIEAAFPYDSSLMADTLPCLLCKGEIVEIPPHWSTGDWPPFAHFEEVGKFMPVLHPFLTGRLARWAAMEAWLDGVIDRGDAWLAPMEEVARHAMTHRDLLRTDTITGEPA